MIPLHTAVLVEETMQVLDVKPGGIYLDATLGGATHTQALLERSAPDGRVYSLDVDSVALGRANCKLQITDCKLRWKGIEANFRHMREVVEEYKIPLLDGLLMDLGLSSDELADASKGLSFLQDGPLDMRLGEKSNEDGLTAATIVNGWKKDELIDLLRTYGEERFAVRIADAIVTARKQHRLTRTTELADLIKSAVPASYERGRLHPATRTFQALRLAVNDELGALKSALQAAPDLLKPNGRIAVISFHSLEDRIVKQAFKTDPRWNVLTKKPIVPHEKELIDNPRSRSAKLRAAGKLQISN